MNTALSSGAWCANAPESKEEAPMTTPANIGHLPVNSFANTVSCIMDDTVTEMVSFRNDDSKSVGDITAFMRLETARMQQIQNMMDSVKKALENANGR
jgi:hypothetical protein